jgi:hypothetical protein
MRGGVLRHLELVDDRPFRDELVDIAQIRRQETEALEAVAVEFAVLVEEGHDGRDLGVLDRPQLVPGGGVEARRPIVGRARLVAVETMPFDRLEPSASRCFGTSRPIRHVTSALL